MRSLVNINTKEGVRRTTQMDQHIFIGIYTQIKFFVSFKTEYIKGKKSRCRQGQIVSRYSPRIEYNYLSKINDC